MQLLHIDSSVLGEHSVSRVLTKEIVAKEVERTTGLKVIYRDLAAQPLGYLTGAHLAVMQGKMTEPPAGIAKDFADGTEALNELLASDVIVIGAPMYNFSIPSQLKSWIDRICVAGKTFKYGSEGPVGLLGGKKVIIASTRGGMYGPETPTAIFDHQEKLLGGIFGFLGVKDVKIIRAEGLAKSEYRATSLEKAHSAIAALV